MTVIQPAYPLGQLKSDETANAIAVARARDMKRRGATLHQETDYSADPRAVILDFLGDTLSGFTLACDKVLVATYRRAEKTAGGIIMTSNELDEDKFQGKAGIIIKLGSLAFKDDARTTHGEFSPKLHDWITFDPNQGKQQEICGLHCRILGDKNILMQVENPNFIW